MRGSLIGDRPLREEVVLVSKQARVVLTSLLGSLALAAGASADPAGPGWSIPPIDLDRILETQPPPAPPAAPPAATAPAEPVAPQPAAIAPAPTAAAAPALPAVSRGPRELLAYELSLLLGFDETLGVPRSPYGEVIYEIASRHGINPHLVAAVIHVESSFNPRAVSRRGACGLMQLIPATARRFGIGKREIFDPRKNIEGGVRYLKWLNERFGNDPARVLAAYNAGEGAVDRFGGVPPYTETRNYVDKVFRLVGLGALVRDAGTAEVLTASVQPAAAVAADPEAAK